MMPSRPRDRRPAVPFGTLLLSLLLLGAGDASPLHAQQDPAERARQEAEQRLGQRVSQDQILERLRESGLSREQARARLRQLGHDPSLVDPYYDRIEGISSDSIPAPTSEFLGGLGRMGLMDPEGVGRIGADTTRADTLRARQRGELADTAALPVFGMEVFSRPTTQFQALPSGPVDPDYRVGPGDQIFLVLTGDVEAAYTLQVSRDGYLVIPDVGRVFVSGLTLDGMESRLHSRLGAVYSGVPSGTTEVGVSVGELRSINVFVIGDVRFPSAYQVSALARVFNALHEAGGPSRTGSFRRIDVRRGGDVIREVDLYDYLLGGASDDDIRLEQGDVVFVPAAGPRVKVTGAVERSAIFETRPGEDLRDVLSFAGGFRPEARVERVHIERIADPRTRVRGADRTVVDVTLEELLDESVPIPVYAGDSIHVATIREERRDVVTVEGQVEETGDFAWRPDLTVWRLVERAGGLLPDAFRPVAHVIRLDPADSTYSLHRVSLEEGPNGERLEDLALQDLDRVVVYGQAGLEIPLWISVNGLVKAPGLYPYARGMTVEDAILAADGFVEGATGLQAEVARLRTRLDRSDTVATSYTVALSGTIPWRHEGAFPDGTELNERLPEADSFELRDGDRVFVRQLPGFAEPREVEVRGQVSSPGPYAFEFRRERLSSFVERAGGLTDDAHLDGARLIRDSIPVGIDLEQALANPGSRADIALEPDDVLEVPTLDGTVLVRGAVAFESRVVYREDLDLQDYIAQAGGMLDNADEDRISVEYANGSRAIVRKRLFLRRTPDVEPGSTIRVAYERERDQVDWGSIVGTTVSVVSALATLALAASRL